MAALPPALLSTLIFTTAGLFCLIKGIKSGKPSANAGAATRLLAANAPMNSPIANANLLRLNMVCSLLNLSVLIKINCAQTNLTIGLLTH